MGAFVSIQDFGDRLDGCSSSLGQAAAPIPGFRTIAMPTETGSAHNPYQGFMGDEARSLIGWHRFGRALPNDAHRALAKLEAMGQSEIVLTQNVDRLHLAAGSERVIDLHGRLDLVRCMGCGQKTKREELQNELVRLNAGWVDLDAAIAPDGDADLDDRDFSKFDVPPCRVCGSVLKPDVVFFGESVPREFVDSAAAHLRHADGVLIVGSSLMVYSAFRFIQMAARAGLPIAAVNLGRTRADDMLALKVEEACENALGFLL